MQAPDDTTSTDPFAPPKDVIFTYLYSRVVNGFLPLFQAEIPIGMIRPFDPHFRPHETELGRKLLNGMIREYNSGRLYLAGWVYASGSAFVLSDDYFVYFAALETGNEVLTCNVMGQQDLVRTTEAAPLEFVRALPGGPDYDERDAQVCVIKESELD